MSEAKILKSLDDLKGYKEIMITGGEPMLRVDFLTSTLTQLRSNNPNVILYVYTALYNPRIDDVMKLSDGVHYTIHENATIHDLCGFEAFQVYAVKNPGKSYRVGIHPDIEAFIPIIPKVWSEVRIKKFKDQSECIIPVTEQLYILDIADYERR